jgi:NADH-quinone oxidoreductase subunit G
MVTDSVRKARAAALYDDDAKKENRLSHRNPYVKRLYEEFLGKPLSEKAEKLLHTEYEARPIYRK